MFGECLSNLMHRRQVRQNLAGKTKALFYLLKSAPNPFRVHCNQILQTTIRSLACGVEVIEGLWWLTIISVDWPQESWTFFSSVLEEAQGCIHCRLRILQRPTSNQVLRRELNARKMQSVNRIWFRLEPLIFNLKAWSFGWIVQGYCGCDNFIVFAL